MRLFKNRLFVKAFILKIVYLKKRLFQKAFILKRVYFKVRRLEIVLICKSVYLLNQNFKKHLFKKCFIEKSD